MAPEFSVIIPTYGRPAFLAEALASVSRQTLTDFECIVVDDATPEPPALPTTDARFRLVRRAANGGPGAARNTGIAEAAGRHLAFLDDDDLWTPDRLEFAASAHGRAPVAVCGQSTLGDDPPARPGRVLEGDVRDVVLDGLTPHLGATSIERAAALAFDERYRGSEDVDWWLRVAQRSRVATTPNVGLLYRRHDLPRSGSTRDDRLFGARLLLDEHADWFAAHPRAEAFRRKRMGLLALQTGDRRLARRCFARSLRLHPQARTAWHALRTLKPARRPGR